MKDFKGGVGVSWGSSNSLLLLLLLLKHEQPVYRQYGWCVLSFILLETRRYSHPFTTPQMLTAGPKQRITLNCIS